MLSDEICRQNSHDLDELYERRRLFERFGNHSFCQHRYDGAGRERKDGWRLSRCRAEDEISHTGGNANE